MSAPAERHMGEGLAVTQADRDAAKALLDRLHIRQHLTGTFRSWDETVQAFAAHRLAATPTAPPSAEDALREALIDRLDEAQDDVRFACNELDRQALSDAADAIADAIRWIEAAAALQSPRASDEVLATVPGGDREAVEAEPRDLDSYAKFDGVGPHAETIATRARIGERYLEAYESALSDPRLAGYCPADCPSELLIDLLNGDRITNRTGEASDEVLGEAGGVASNFEAALRRIGAQIDSGEAAGAVTRTIDGKRYVVIPYDTYEGDLMRRFERGKAYALSASPVPVDASGTVRKVLDAFAMDAAEVPEVSAATFIANRSDTIAKAILAALHTAPVADAQAGEGDRG